MSTLGRFCLLLAAAGGASGVNPTPSNASTLGDAIAAAYQSNPTLQSQRQALKEVNEAYVQARAALGPRLGISAELAQDQTRIDTLQQPGSGIASVRANARTAAESLSLSETLYDGGLSAARIAAARYDIFAARAQLRASEIEVLHNVIEAYVAVFRDSQIVDISKVSLSLLQQHDTDVEQRLRVHEVTRTDRAQAEARLENAKAALVAAQSRLEISRTQFQQFVGESPKALEEPVELQGTPGTLSDSLNMADHQNPFVVASRFTEQASHARVVQARSEGHATLSASAVLSNGPLEPYDSRLYQNGATVRLSVSKPLYTSGLVASHIRAAVDHVNRDRAQIEVSRRDAAQRAGQAWNQVQAAAVIETIQRRQLAVQIVAYDSVRAELKAGFRTLIEVLNAEQELQNARQAVVQAQSDGYSAQAALLAATGQLDPEKLNPRLRAYDPDVALSAVKNSGLPPWITLLEFVNQLGAKGLPAPSSGAGDTDGRK